MGGRDIPGRPNVLRAILGESVSSEGDHDWETDTVTLLETNLDDCRPEILGHLVDQVLELGALDVFHTPIQMKKNRPGVLLSVLCRPEDADDFRALILCETTAFGVRSSTMDRRKLKRAIDKVETEFGPIQIKLGYWKGKVIHAEPEYESCRIAAQTAKVPMKVVYGAVEGAVRSKGDSE